MVLVDRIDYLPTNPWPATASGTGASLQRVNSSAFGNDPANWVAAGPSPGTEPVVGDPPVITVPPQPLTVVEESTATFEVTVTGTAPLLYQWFLNGLPIDGAYSSILTLDNVQPGQAGNYSVFVLNGSGTVLSGDALLTVQPIPVITLHPASTNITLTVGVPRNLTLRVAATGTGTLLYQWQHNGADIPDATSTSYTITNAQPADSGVYRALVTDTIGTRASLPATVNFSIRPAIVQQPQPQTVVAGQDAVYTVAASGTTPMGFRWRRNAVTITTDQEGFVIENEQTNSTLTQLGVTYLNDFDRISVVITNLAGAAPVSVNALLRVLYPPVLTAEPTNFLANAGTNVTFRALFRANPEASYWWWFNETNLLFSRAGVVGTNVNSTNVSLVVSNVQAAHEGLYTLTVSNEHGLTTSTGAVLTLRKPPTIVTQPLSQTASPGADVTLSVEVNGTEPLRYTWKFNGTNLPGATNATLELANVQVAQAGDYLVVVTNALGAATSDVATLTVQVSPALSDVSYDVTTGKMLFSVATVAGVTYIVEFKDDLAAAEWQQLRTIPGDGTVVLVEDAVAPPPSQRFYQIRVQ
jgi:hypothetical protein